MKRYDSYKDSGVEWIGEIPNHWEKSPVKYYYDYKKGSRGQELTKTYIQNNIGEYPVYSGQTKDQGVLGKINDYEFDFSEEVIFTTTVGVKMMSTKVLRNKFSLSQNCLIMIPKREINSRFVNYYISVDWVFRKLQFPKILQPSLRMEDIDQYFFYCPTSNEQQQIVSFLDTKTSLIDSLIEKTQRKIELLKEKRTSLINEVVTKGLNPNVEMKDSGVEWIGEIPSSWKTMKLKYISEITYGISPPDTTYNDEGIGTILINGPVEYSETDFGLTRSLKWTTEPKKFTSKGSLLFCLRGSTTGRMNITHTDVSIGRGVCSINSSENQWFLIYSMFSVRRWIQDQISGSTFPSVTSDDVNNYQICSPPFSEQQQIVEYLDEQTQLIDSTISIEEKRIELLKEYRQSLISEVVTGKRKVV